MIGQRTLDIFPGEFRCRRCGKRIYSTVSIMVGLGPECRTKARVLRAGSKRILNILHKYEQREAKLHLAKSTQSRLVNTESAAVRRDTDTKSIF